MKKYTKFGATFIIILSLIFGFVVYAEDTTNTNIEDNENKRDEFKNEVRGVKDELNSNREEYKIQMEQMIQSVKAKRQEFKTELETKKEESKLKLTEMKVNFREGLNKIKNEGKKISAEKIVDIIQSLNIKLTDNLSEKLNKIENVLVSIESRISKAESNDLDVTTVKVEVEKAKTAIALAREAISAQASKVYEVNITDEASLKAEMKDLRDTFTTNIKAVREKVKLAHQAVRDTATTLAQIPKIDEEEVEVNSEVEDNGNVNNN
jgi:DNA repair exonuclease SbcCD ATPase subunit